jgi:hypothetical protein
MARPESQIPLAISIPSSEKPQRELDIDKITHDFGKFIANSPVKEIAIHAVIPSTRLGIMYIASVGIEDSTEIDGEIHKGVKMFYIDNRILDSLEDNLQRLSKRKKAKTKMLRKNLLAIRDAISNAFNWGDPFNTRTDN